MRSPNGKDKFQCSVPGCGKSFNHRGKFNRHVLTHTNYRPYACQHPGCSKRFGRREHLRRHELSHEPVEERPYQCAECGARFTCAHHLKRHEKLHSDARPFVCHEQGCGETFRKARDLRLHRAQRHMAAFKCLFEGCDRTFDTADALESHLCAHPEASLFVGGPGDAIAVALPLESDTNVTDESHVERGGDKEDISAPHRAAEPYYLSFPPFPVRVKQHIGTSGIGSGAQHSRSGGQSGTRYSGATHSAE